MDQLVIKGEWGIGGTGTGNLQFLKNNENEVLDVYDVDISFKNRILVISGQITQGFYYKALGIGVAGLIIRALTKDSWLLPEEEVELPLVVLGETVKETTLNTLKINEGSHTIIDGNAAQITLIKTKTS